MGRYTTATTRTSTSNRYGKTDFNISSDVSLTGRDLKTPDELMNIEVGDTIILRTKMLPIKTKLKQLKEYPIKYRTVDNIIVKQKNFHKAELFDLDTFRIEQELFQDETNDVSIPKADPTKKRNNVISKSDN